MKGVEELSPMVGTATASRALGVARSSVYRRRAPSPPPAVRPVRPPSPRRLGESERQEVLAVLHSERFVDRSPAHVVPTLLDEERYLCSVRTMYRVLEEQLELQERRRQRRHPKRARPQLVARGPNQVWSWDITYLPTQVRGVFLYLYVLLDLFSRYVVGWTMAESETASVARRLIGHTASKWGIGPGRLTLHSDRGAPMVAKTVVELQLDLAIQPSFSRPRTSDDNPYSESFFKTAKYHPSTPERFEGLEAGLAWGRSLFDWYNNDHRHSGIAWLPPASVHFGQAEAMLDARHRVMLEAYARHPERFVQGPPRRRQLPPEVWINPPLPELISPEINPQAETTTASGGQARAGLREGREPGRDEGAPASAPLSDQTLIVVPYSGPVLTNSATQVSQTY